MDAFVQLLSTAFALFLLMDPIGNVPIFISVLKDIDPKRQQYIIFRELVIALIIIIAFDFLGDLLLEFLNVERATLLIAGGIILFIIALKMIFPGKRDPDVDISPDKEPFIVPLAIPLVAGPAVLAAVMLYSHEQYSEWITVGAIVLAWIASTIILLSAGYLKKLLGWRGLVACERLMGLLLILISVQMFLSGIVLFLGPHGSFTQQ
ncbi:MAG: YhgN family NAAT transporter [Verrucomicrobia bacterium]|nr:YhgN family NAAT transporter [Verrucomicrobiota bacterium]